MNTIALRRLGILACLLLTAYIIVNVPNATAVPMPVAMTNANAEQAHTVPSQTSPLSSPLAMPQGNLAQSRRVSLSQIQLPIYSGQPANQSSPVLIGAVLVGLVMVGISIFTRKE